MRALEGPHRAAALEQAVAGLNVLAVGDGDKLPPQFQECSKALDSYGLVAMLRASIPRDDGEPRRRVHGPDRALGLVLVLTARPAGAKRLETHIGRIELGRPNRKGCEFEDANEPIFALVVRPERALRHPEDGPDPTRCKRLCTRPFDQSNRRGGPVSIGVRSDRHVEIKARFPGFTRQNTQRLCQRDAAFRRGRARS